MGFCHWTPLGDLRFSDPLIAHPWKKFCGHPWDTVYIMLQVTASEFDLKYQQRIVFRITLLSDINV